MKIRPLVYIPYENFHLVIAKPGCEIGQLPPLTPLKRPYCCYFIINRILPFFLVKSCHQSYQYIIIIPKKKCHQFRKEKKSHDTFSVYLFKNFCAIFLNLYFYSHCILTNVSYILHKIIIIIIIKNLPNVL